MSVSSTGSKGEPQFESTGNAPTFAADLTATSDYAALVGNRIAGTSAERLAFDDWPGLAWHETDTDLEYEMTASGWRLVTRPHCVLGLTANQALGTVAAAVAWDSEVSDPFGMHANVPNPSRITAPAAGLYEVSAYVFNTNTAGLGQVYGRKNGTDNITGSLDRDNSPGVSFALQSTFTVQLAVGDYVEVMVLHSTATGAIEGGILMSGARVSVKRIGA